eukprot:5246475-Pyramimonas_sp.AAC.1
MLCRTSWGMRAPPSPGGSEAGQRRALDGSRELSWVMLSRGPESSTWAMPACHQSSTCLCTCFAGESRTALIAIGPHAANRVPLL